MNAIRTNRLLRIAIVTMALFGWLVLSNHCALAESLAPHARAHAESGSCCHQSPGSKHDEKPCPQMPQGCCKTLKVAMPDGAKLPLAATADIALVVVEIFHALTLAADAEIAAAPATGPPPDVPSFAELVLHQSLRSHAPPVLA